MYTGVKKRGAFVVHSHEPLNLEAPAEALAAGPLTPPELFFFVRNRVYVSSLFLSGLAILLGVTAFDVHQHLWTTPLLEALAERVSPPLARRAGPEWMLQAPGEPAWTVGDPRGLTARRLSE